MWEELELSLNKKVNKIDLSRGSTVFTFGDVFKVRRRVIEEQEDGRTIIVIVLQDVESSSIEEKEIQEQDQIDKKIQGIDKGMVEEELQRIRKNKDDPSSNFDGSASNYNG